MFFKLLLLAISHPTYFGHDRIHYEWNTSTINSSNLWVSLVENQTNNFYTLPNRGSPLFHINIENNGLFSWTIPDIQFLKQLYRFCFSDNELPDCLDIDFNSESSHQYFDISPNIITNFSLDIPDSFYINQNYNITVLAEPRNRLYIYGGVVDQNNNYISVFPPILFNSEASFYWYSGHQILQPYRFKFMGYTRILGISGDFVLNCFDTDLNYNCDSYESMVYYSDIFYIYSAPSVSPTFQPSFIPTTSFPTVSPSFSPTTILPTILPSIFPTTNIPSISPMMKPSYQTSFPTAYPTQSPTIIQSTFSPSLSNSQIIEEEEDENDSYYINMISIIIYSSIGVILIIIMIIVTKTCKRTNYSNRVGINNPMYDNSLPNIEHHRHFLNETYGNRSESHL